MDHREASAMWDQNAEVWTKLARQGYDTFRDLFNTPAFMAMLPDVKGLHGLDIGCGEANNTRHVARRGAKMTALDPSSTFLKYAQETEVQDPLGIQFVSGSAVRLPFADASFDFATAFMSLMEFPETEAALKEAHRVIKPGGFLQFSIMHPCFMTPKWKWIKDENGNRAGAMVGDYFAEREDEIQEWIFSSAPEEVTAGLRPFRIPIFYRTLSRWMNGVVNAGFRIEQLAEPTASDEVIAKRPDMAKTREMAFFLIVRARK